MSAGLGWVTRPTFMPRTQSAGRDGTVRGWQPARSLTPRGDRDGAGSSSSPFAAATSPAPAPYVHDSSVTPRRTAPSTPRDLGTPRSRAGWPSSSSSSSRPAAEATTLDGQAPRHLDRTWSVAGSRSVGSVLNTPRSRSVAPRRQDYGAWNHAHDGTWSQVVMPHGRLAERSAAPERTPGMPPPPAPQAPEGGSSAASVLQREQAMREASMRERALQHRKTVAERSRHASRMPRGRFREEDAAPSAAAESARTDSSQGRAIHSWADRMALSRAQAMSRPNANPYSYKAAFDRGQITVLTNWRQGYAGKGAERYTSGDLYVGDIHCGEREGRGLFQLSDGELLVSEWRSNEPVGEGVQWSADRSKAVRIVDGKPDRTISDAQARQIAKRLGSPAAPSFHHARPFTWGLAGSPEELTQGDALNAAKVRRQRCTASPRSPDKQVVRI